MWSHRHCACCRWHVHAGSRWWQARWRAQGGWRASHWRGATHWGWPLLRGVLLLMRRRAHAKAGRWHQRWPWRRHTSIRLTPILKVRGWWPSHAWWWPHAHRGWWTHVGRRWKTGVKGRSIARWRRPSHHGPHHWGRPTSPHHAWRRTTKPWRWTSGPKTWWASWRKTIGASVAVHKTAFNNVVGTVAIRHFKTTVSH